MMAPMKVSVLKFVGSISLGLLTGVSYTLSNVTIPSLLALPSSSTGFLAFTQLSTRAITELRIWAGASTMSFLLAYALSPRGTRHPYLLWTSLLVTVGGSIDYILRPERTKSVIAPTHVRHRDRTGKMEASYDVLGDSHSEGNASTSDEGEEEINGEEVRTAMENFAFRQSLRAGVSAIAFAMSVIGIWGDNA